MQDFIHRFNLLVGRCVEHNDHGSNEADGATESTESTELFVEEI